MKKQAQIPNLWLPYLACDVCAVMLAYCVAIYLRFFSAWGQAFYAFLIPRLGVREPVDLSHGLHMFYVESAPRITILIALTVCILYGFMNLYGGRRFILRRPVAWHIIIANALALGLFYTYFYVRWNVFHPRTVFVTVMAINTLFCILFRKVLYRILQKLRVNTGIDTWPAILIGSGPEADTLAAIIEAEVPHGVHVVQRIPARAVDMGPDMYERLTQTVAEHGAKLIICALPDADAAHFMELVARSENMGVAVKVLSHDLDLIVTQAHLAVDILHGVPLVHFGRAGDRKLWHAVHRLASTAIASVLSVLLLPVWILLAFLVRLGSKGPAVYVQERIGLKKEPFKMYKFRTMHEVADEIQEQYEEHNESDAVLFKMKKDPRVTMAGRLLRRFSLDELPQLLNVVGGSMNLVGPRPLPRRDYEKYYEDWQYYRHHGQPGMTGLWQVSGRSDIDFLHMCVLDIYFLRNESWLMDLKILLKTVWVVLFAKGAY